LSVDLVLTDAAYKIEPGGCSGGAVTRCGEGAEIRRDKGLENLISAGWLLIGVNLKQIEVRSILGQIFGAFCYSALDKTSS